MSETPQQNRRRRRRSPVPLEVIQKNISVSMAQVIVNMTDPTLQAYCMQLLQINDVMQADANILKILQDVDAEQEEKGNGATRNRRRRLQEN